MKLISKLFDIRPSNKQKKERVESYPACCQNLVILGKADLTLKQQN